MHARQLFGYYRIDNPDTVALINDLYANEWNLYQNYYCPSQKLITKTKIGGKYSKSYEKPITPYQRLINSDSITAEQKALVTAIYRSVNPFTLKKHINTKLNAIFKLISVTSFLRQQP